MAARRDQRTRLDLVSAAVEKRRQSRGERVADMPHGDLILNEYAIWRALKDSPEVHERQRAELASDKMYVLFSADHPGLADTHLSDDTLGWVAQGEQALGLPADRAFWAAVRQIRATRPPHPRQVGNGFRLEDFHRDQDRT